MHRFFVPPDSWGADSLALDAEQSRHCADSVRCREGDRVVIFNGAGTEALAEITSCSSREVHLRILSTTKSDPLPTRITLGQAVPKGKNMDLIIQKATELGAAGIIPILSERTVVSYTAAEAERKQRKWRKVAIEACKQSGQNWIPEVAEPQPLDRALAAVSGFDLLLIASLGADARSLREILAEHEAFHGGRPRSVLALIGPEGDFTPAEINLAKANSCQPVSLGPIVLRVETASLYVLSILGYELLA